MPELVALLVSLLVVFLFVLCIILWNKYQANLGPNNQIRQENLRLRRVLDTIEDDARLWEDEEPHLAALVVRHTEAAKRKEI